MRVELIWINVFPLESADCGKLVLVFSINFVPHTTNGVLENYAVTIFALSKKMRRNPP
jgi:hypothetical protein